MAKKTKAELAEIEESRVELGKALNPMGVTRSGDSYARLGAHPDDEGLVYPHPVHARDVSNCLPTLYFVVESVSRSGMSRTMRVYVQATDDRGRPYLRWITGHVAKVLGWRMVRGWKDAVRVDGCGMDMCFHLTDCLLHAVFGYGPNALNANHFRREVL